MKVRLILVGKTVDKHLAVLCEDYATRLMHYTDIDCVVLPDVKYTKSLSEAQQKAKEGELILKAVEACDEVCLLDERGEMWTSDAFAEQLARWGNRGLRQIAFVIGGPYGFPPEVYARATRKLSLSRMTFSHQMVRLIFLEQLYRAHTILKGEPYHHR